MAAPSAAPLAVPRTYGIGQRVAQQALERRAGDGQPGADDGRRQHARQAQLDDDGLGGRRPGRGHRPAQALGEDGDRVADGHGDVAERDAGHDGHRERRQGPESDRDRPTAQGLEPADAQRRAGLGGGAGAHRSAPSAASARPGADHGAGLGRTRSGWMAGASEASPSASRGPGSRHDDVVDRPDGARLDRGHDVPAGSRRDLLAESCRSSRRRAR